MSGEPVIGSAPPVGMTVSAASRSSSPFVFISYAHEDSAFATQFGQRLERHGIPYFRDTQIGHGEVITEKVRVALERSTHIVVLVSPGSDQSVWVPYETGYADGRNVLAIPYLLYPGTKVPGFLSGRRYLTRQDERRFVAELQRQVAANRPASVPDEIPAPDVRVVKRTSASLLQALSSMPPDRVLPTDVADAIMSVVDISTSVDALPPSFGNAIRRATATLRKTVNEARDGCITVPVDAAELLAAEVAACKDGDCISAISFAMVDLDLWTGRRGDPYFQAQVEARRRGVTIERIFVAADPSTVVDEMRRQVAHDFKVYFVRLEVVPDDLLQDIGIYRQRVCYYSRFTPRGRPVEAKLDRRESEIEAVSERYDQLRRLARAMDEPALASVARDA